MNVIRGSAHAIAIAQRPLGPGQVTRAQCASEARSSSGWEPAVSRARARVGRRFRPLASDRLAVGGRTSMAPDHRLGRAGCGRRGTSRGFHTLRRRGNWYARAGCADREAGRRRPVSLRPKPDVPRRRCSDSRTGRSARPMAAAGVRARVRRHRVVVRALVRGTDAPSTVWISVRALLTHRSRLVATTTAASYDLNVGTVVRWSRRNGASDLEPTARRSRRGSWQGRRPLHAPPLSRRETYRSPIVAEGVDDPAKPPTVLVVHG
jgi:hypothetical protein